MFRYLKPDSYVPLSAQRLPSTAAKIQDTEKISIFPGILFSFAKPAIPYISEPEDLLLLPCGPFAAGCRAGFSFSSDRSFSNARFSMRDT